MNLYEKDWKEYRIRRKRILVLIVAEFLAFIPVVALVAIVERKLFSTAYLGFPTAVVWGTLYLSTGFRLRKFPCPRCSKNFFGKMGGPLVFFGQRCAYCGLRKYSDA
jgi:hypothetical protein